MEEWYDDDGKTEWYKIPLTQLAEFYQHEGEDWDEGWALEQVMLAHEESFKTLWAAVKPALITERIKVVQFDIVKATDAETARYAA